MRLSSARNSRADPVALGKAATGLLDVLPTKQHATTEYAYLRQTTRTNTAAVVAEGVVAAINGSSAFGEVARAVIAFTLNLQSGDGTGVLSQEKNNAGQCDLALEYAIESTIDSRVSRLLGHFIEKTSGAERPRTHDAQCPRTDDNQRPRTDDT